MKITIKKEKPSFSFDISYEDYRSKMAKIYKMKVKPQIEARKNNEFKSINLSDIQKAHINCNGPI